MSNLETIKQYHDAIWGDKDIHAIDKFVAADALIHSPIESTQGTDKMKEIISSWHTAFPNLKLHWQDYICEGDKVVARWQAEGLHEGDFFNIAATNKPVFYHGITIYQLEDGKIKEYWAQVDLYGLLSMIS